MEAGTVAPTQFQPCLGLTLSCLSPRASGTRIYKTWAAGRVCQTPFCNRLQSKNHRIVCRAQQEGSPDLAMEAAASDRPPIRNGHRTPATRSSSHGTRGPGSSAPTFAPSRWGSLRPLPRGGNPTHEVLHPSPSPAFHFQAFGLDLRVSE